MGHIWSLCNKATPGQLIKAELYQMLALIALAQVNIHHIIGRGVEIATFYTCPGTSK